jgi:hypothetical protein
VSRGEFDEDSFIPQATVADIVKLVGDESARVLQLINAETGPVKQYFTHYKRAPLLE